jgi:hypothetical protein
MLEKGEYWRMRSQFSKDKAKNEGMNMFFYFFLKKNIYLASFGLDF